MKFYPLADKPYKEAKDFGLAPTEFLGNIKAVRTGEFRNPKKGEWYISGAIVEAYKARNDLSSSFHIVKLVLTKRETRIVLA